METKLFEAKPRWKNAPQICLAENLPAFKSAKDALKYKERYCPGCNLDEIWECSACDQFHINLIPMSPAGASSGSGRYYKCPQPKFRK